MSGEELMDVMEDEEEADSVQKISSTREALSTINTAIAWLECHGNTKEMTADQAKKLMKNAMTEDV